MGRDRKRPNRRWERRAEYRREGARIRQWAERQRQRAIVKHEFSLSLRDMLKHLGRLLRGHRVTRREHILGEQPGGVDE